MKKPRIGDYIVFSATTRYGRRKLRRKVNGFHGPYPTVRAHGWDQFVVGCFPGDVIHAVERGEPVK